VGKIIAADLREIMSHLCKIAVTQPWTRLMPLGGT